MCAKPPRTAACCLLAAAVLGAGLITIFGFGCLAGSAVDAKALEAAKAIDSRLAYRGAATAALGGVVALALVAAWTVWRCCCSGGKDGPPTGALPLAQSDVEAGDGQPAAAAGKAKAKRGAACMGAEAAPLEPSPRSRGPLYPIAGQEPEPEPAPLPQRQKKKRRAAMCASETGPLMPSPTSRGPLYPLPPTAAELAKQAKYDELCATYGKPLVDELIAEKNSVVKRKAVDAGATEEQLDDATDSETPKEALRELLLKLLHPEL